MQHNFDTALNSDTEFWYRYRPIESIQQCMCHQLENIRHSYCTILPPCRKRTWGSCIQWLKTMCAMAGKYQDDDVVFSGTDNYSQVSCMTCMPVSKQQSWLRARFWLRVLDEMNKPFGKQSSVIHPLLLSAMAPTGPRSRNSGLIRSRGYINMGGM